MTTTFPLPSDEQVRAELIRVRASVIDATHHVRSPRHSTRYRTTRTVIIAVTTAAILTAGAIAVVRASDVEINSTVTCYEHASFDSRMHMFASTDAEGNPTTELDPIGLCGLVWTNDSWTSVSNNDPDDPNGGDAPIPPLVACTQNTGTVAVFPREGSTATDIDFCGALGLADWGSD